MDHLKGIGPGAGGPLAESGGGISNGAEKPGGFSKLLEDVVGETNRLQQTADGAVVKLTTGKTDDIHNVMLALNRADLSFRMMVEVRNKLVEAYQEVMRMQV